MLKQILATSTLIVIGAFSIQSAGAVEASKLRQLVVEPAGTPAAAATKTDRTQFVVKPAEGIPTPTQTADIGSDAGEPAKTKAIPLIADQSQGIPAATDSAEAAAAAAAGPQPAAAPIAAAAPAPIGTGLQSQKGLYLLLTGRGYGVEILERTADGNLLFSVTVPGHPGEAYLLLVDEYGKVIERRHVVTAHGYSDDRGVAPTYAPRYPAAYAATEDNCDDNAGY